MSRILGGGYSLPIFLRISAWITASLILLGGMWWASLARYDAVALQQAQQALHRLEQATPFAWTFDQPSDLTRKGRHGLAKLQFKQGYLQATAANADPYFHLALHGYAIDTKRFHTLTLRVYSDAPSHLDLFFRSRPNDTFLFASPPLLLRQGWQTLTVELSTLAWSKIDLISAKRATESALWGGAAQVVSSLRIDPVPTAGILFKVDDIRLSGSPPPLLPPTGAPLQRLAWQQPLPEPLLSWPIRSISFTPGQWQNSLSQIAQKRDELLLLEDISPIRTPESTLWLREKIKQIAPSAILFPRAVSFAALSTQALAKPSTPLLALYSVSATMICLVLLFGWQRARWLLMPSRLRAALEILLFALLSISLWWLLPQLPGQFWPPLLLVIPYLLLCLQLNGNQPYSWRQAIIGKPGAWRAALHVTLPLLVMLCIVAWLGQGFATLTLTGLLLYPIWALLQQYLVGVVFALRLHLLLGRDAAILVAAALFGWLHYPNFALMSITFLMGLIWVHLYLRYRSLLPLALSHGILASLFLCLAPELISGEVGSGYLARIWGK